MKTIKMLLHDYNISIQGSHGYINLSRWNCSVFLHLPWDSTKLLAFCVDFMRGNQNANKADSHKRF